MKKALRLGLVSGLVVTAFAAPHAARAQGNTDDAHELCAQGGEEDGLAGAGGTGGTFSLRDLDNMTDSQLAAIGNGEAGSDDAGGSGGGGPGGGLGGREGVGGGAGGCLRDVEEVVPRRPVRIIERPVIVTRTRNLPVTGSAAENIAYMGGAFVLAGGALLTANRRRVRLEHAASEGLVWDAFGGTRIPLGRGSFGVFGKKD